MRIRYIFALVIAALAVSARAQGGPKSLTSHTCPAGIPLAVRIVAENLAQAAKAAAVLADIVLEAVPNDTASAGVRAAAAILWGIPQEAAVAAEEAVLILEQIQKANDECEEANHQAILHDLTERMRVHLQVIELEHGDSREFLVSASEAGLPVDVQFIAVQVSDDDPVFFVDVTANTTVTVVKQGIHRVVIDPFEDDHIFEFRVLHDHGTLTQDGQAELKHFGTILFHEDHGDNLGMGQ